MYFAMEINNNIIRSILLCRYKEFVKHFNMATNNGDVSHCCHFGFNAISVLVYAMKVLLNDKSWNEHYTPIIDYCRAEIEKIRDLLSLNNLVPDDCEQQLIERAQVYAWHDKNDTYEDVFFKSLEDLEKDGAKKIDVDLFMAVNRLDFQDVKELLKCGANPDAEILVREGSDDEYPEIWNSLEHAGMLWGDAYTGGQDMHVELWEKEYNKDKNIIVTERDLIQVFISSSNKLMYELLESYATSEKS